MSRFFTCRMRVLSRNGKHDVLRAWTRVYLCATRLQFFMLQYCTSFFLLVRRAQVAYQKSATHLRNAFPFFPYGQYVRHAVTRAYACPTLLMDFFSYLNVSSLVGDVIWFHCRELPQTDVIQICNYRRKVFWRETFGRLFKWNECT